MFAEFEERIAFTATLQLEMENVLIKRFGFFDVVYLDGNVIHSIDMYAHRFLKGFNRAQVGVL